MILIGRGLDFTRENEINRLANKLDHVLCSCQGCVRQSGGVREEEEKDDRACRTFRERDECDGVVDQLVNNEVTEIAHHFRWQ